MFANGGEFLVVGLAVTVGVELLPTRPAFPSAAGTLTAQASDNRANVIVVGVVVVLLQIFDEALLFVVIDFTIFVGVITGGDIFDLGAAGGVLLVSVEASVFVFVIGCQPAFRRFRGAAFTAAAPAFAGASDFVVAFV